MDSFECMKNEGVKYEYITTGITATKTERPSEVIHNTYEKKNGRTDILP
jgi:hypothetical protein